MFFFAHKGCLAPFSPALNCSDEWGLCLYLSFWCLLKLPDCFSKFPLLKHIQFLLFQNYLTGQAVIYLKGIYFQKLFSPVKLPTIFVMRKLFVLNSGGCFSLLHNRFGENVVFEVKGRGSFFPLPLS